MVSEKHTLLMIHLCKFLNGGQPFEIRIFGTVPMDYPLLCKIVSTIFLYFLTLFQFELESKVIEF